MVIRNWIQPDALVDALNVRPLDRLAELHFAERYAAAGGDLPRKETRPFAAALLSSALREYVDNWLRSGVNPDGSESPSKRKLFGSSYAAVLEYMDRYPPRVGLDHRAGVTLDIGEPVLFASGPGQLYAATSDEAKRFFCSLMASNWLESLCKCRYPACGRYFLLAKPRGVRKHGTFCCRQHQARASAAACVKERRVAAHRELVEFAAKWLADWGVKSPEWVNNTRLKSRLADALSGNIRRKRHLRALVRDIKVKWVTRHRLAIEQKREGIA